jgi:hypothetical protein
MACDISLGGEARILVRVRVRVKVRVRGKAAVCSSLKVNVHLGSAPGG